MPTNEDINPKKTTDWTKKGFGWVPDYPDIRDFFPLPSRVTDQDKKKLPRHQQELQKEGMISDLESLTENVIEAIEQFYELTLDPSSRDTPNEAGKCAGNLQSILKRLRKTADGGIQFQATRIYRVLSKDTAGYTAEAKDQEQRQEIIQLKHCLYYLISQGQLNSPTQQLGDLIHWLSDPNFDDKTDALVREFQTKNGLRVDGIVGLNTYLTLENHLKNLADLEFSASSRVKHTPYPCPTTDTESIRQPAKLITLSSLVPRQVFETLINDYPKWLEAFPELATLKADEPFLLDYKRLIAVVQQEDLEAGQLLANYYVPDFELESIPITKEQLIELCSREFLIIDPVVSVILEIISPLANQASLQQAVLEGIQKFEKMLRASNQKSGSTSPEFLNQPDESDSLIVLAKTSVLKAQNLLEVEKSEKIDNIKKILIQAENIDQADESQQEEFNKLKHELLNDLCPTLVFYSLFTHVILHWRMICGMTRSSSTLNLEEFSKKELFEVVSSDVSESGSLQTSQLKKPSHSTKPLLPSDNSPSLPDQPVGGSDAPDETTSLLQLQFFVRPEIVLPISSAASRLKLAASSKPPKDRKKSGQLKPTSPDGPRPYFFLPGAVDLSFWCSPIEDQGELNTCTACAGVGLLEYFAKRSFGEFEDLSPLFLYKVARNLRKRDGDVGAPLRDIMRTMVLFGVPPERYWPYRIDSLDEEPPAFCYSYAQNYQTLKYFRLDRADVSARNLLLKAKAVLAAGFPCMFGFTVYSSLYIDENIEQGLIPFPDRDRDRVAGGHAVVAVGYNDFKRIRCSNGSGETRGALLIRNSWGKDWGNEGYGWLPYEYVLKGLTADWWSLLKAEWFGRGYFGLEASDPGGVSGGGQGSTNTSTRRRP